MAETKKNGLSETEKVALKQKAKELVMDEFKIDEKEAELLEVAMEEAKMPVEMKDSDMKLGERELDIRKLSKTNKEQMMFRMAILNVVYQRQIVTSLVDIQRLLMLVLKKQGVEDVVAELDELINDLAKKIHQETKN